MSSSKEHLGKLFTSFPALESAPIAASAMGATHSLQLCAKSIVDQDCLNSALKNAAQQKQTVSLLLQIGDIHCEIASSRAAHTSHRAKYAVFAHLEEALCAVFGSL